jgi:CHASE2 domain-containing sensor protein
LLAAELRTGSVAARRGSRKDASNGSTHVRANEVIRQVMSVLRRVIASPVLTLLTVIALGCGLQVADRTWLQSGIFQRFEWMTYDWRVRLAARHPLPAATNLGFVFISDDSIKAVGNGMDGALPYQFGLYWPRQVYGRLLHELAAQGAAAVGMDVLFTDLRPDQPAIVLPDGVQMGSDEFFASEIRKSGNIVLASDLGVVPHELFRTNAYALADIAAQREADGILRRARAFQDVLLWHPLIMDAERLHGWDLRQAVVEQNRVVFRTSDGQKAVLALTNRNQFNQAELFKRISGSKAPPETPMWSPAFTRVRCWQMGIALAAKAMRLDLSKARIEPDKGRITLSGEQGITRIIPIDAEGRFYVDWHLALNHPALTRESIESLLVHYEARRAGRLNELTNRWKDKLVIVGSVAAGNGLSDLGATPLERETFLFCQQWNVANSLLMQRFIRTSALWLDLLLIGGFGLLSGLLIWNWRPWKAFLGLLTLSLLYVWLTAWFYIQWRWWLPVVLPVGTAAVIAQVGLITRKADPRAVARRFFSHAGFRKVQSLPGGLLLLHPKEGQTTALVAFWPERSVEIPQAISKAVRSHGSQAPGELKLYLIYRGNAPVSQVIQTWRARLGCEIIAVLATMLERALATRNYERQLKELEEPYLVRVDPYAEFKPISDPMWFYGRGDLLDRLRAALAQGQHVGVFGLRKVGKTSLTNQLRQRFVATPSVFLDCQGLSTKAESYFDAIYRELHAELRALQVSRLPGLHRIADAEDFSRSLVSLFECWEKAGQREPFILILDEIDKFFPNPEVSGREAILTEYVRVFRVLRSLAQSRQCLVLLVIAYRPAVSRLNLLTPKAGENPMFSSFQEHYLGFLNPADSQALVREIGLWKNIVWEDAAARAVFQYCGGHPLITRHFASQACKKGALKNVSEARVLETAGEIEKTLRKNEIGNYYKEGVWELLLEDERQALALIVHGDGCDEEAIPAELEEGLSNLERFGLVENRNGRLCITAELFRAWLGRRVSL